MEQKTIQPISENLWRVIPRKLAGVHNSVAKAYEEFKEDGTMKDSLYRDRMVDVMKLRSKYC